MPWTPSITAPSTAVQTTTGADDMDVDMMKDPSYQHFLESLGEYACVDGDMDVGDPSYQLYLDYLDERCVQGRNGGRRRCRCACSWRF
mmetsp:Transcript_56304/g.163297  ORF Transcript_56304/g.163297 Transcript_56304/m.163297 type:complete len:88 (+) Transcript_56304:486-749(+)